MSTRSGSRVTIGVLVGWQVYDGPSMDPSVAPILRGIQATAQKEDVNLLVAAGLSLSTDRQRVVPAWPCPCDHADFVPVGDANTDGLIILSPVHLPECKAEIHRLLAKEFPLVFVGAGDGTPGVVVDNPGGIRSILEHLQFHGHRQIAFIAGVPEKSDDSQERLEVYLECVRELGLEKDPRIVEYGRHTMEGGYLAMRRIVQSGAQFSAVLASNDSSAVGAMRALLEIGLHIPQDVAVAGFNDQADVATIGPPLTSVHFPMFESGSRAVRMLLQCIEEGPGSLPAVTRMGTWLVKRQSCGCVAGESFRSELGSSAPSSENLAQAMTDVLLAEAPSADAREVRMDCECLLQSFRHSLEDDDPAPFQVAVTGIVQRVDLQNEDAHAWQAAISVLRQHLPILFAENVREPENRIRAEDLLHQARTLLEDSARRRHTRLQMQYAHRLEAMGRLVSRLMASTNEDQILAGLTEGLHQVSVSAAHVAFLKPREEDRAAGSLIRFPHSNRPPSLFESRHFPPEGLYPPDKAYQAILLPLVAREGQLGYIAFSSKELDSLAAIARQVASLLVGVHLEARLKKLALRDPLTGYSNQRYFNIILREEIQRCRHNGQDLSVILVDVDHFRQYNDAFGYSAGDEALREVGRCISRSARRGLDFVARFGGDKFALVLPETGVAGAQKVADEIRQQVVEDSRIRQPLTVSLGVASARGTSAQAALLVRRAGQARSWAKVAGPNQAFYLEGK